MTSYPMPALINSLRNDNSNLILSLVDPKVAHFFVVD